MLPAMKWTASPNYSARRDRVRLIVAHDCEGSYAGSIAWFSQARSQVSAHLVLREDGAEMTQMVAFGNKAWHACAFNPFSEGIEAAGFSAKGLGDPEWKALASVVAWRLRANELPCQEASAANDWTGFTEHAKLGVAGGGHHDITESADVWARFVALVQAAYGLPQDPTPPRAETSAPAPPAPAGWTPCATKRCDEAEGSFAWAQARLNALGYAHPPLIVDGLDGPRTEQAASLFQGARGLYVDGIIGPRTLAALAA